MITFTYQHSEFEVKLTHSDPDMNLDEICKLFKQFLAGAGYHLDHVKDLPYD